MFRSGRELCYGGNRMEEDRNRKLCTPLSTGIKIWNKILYEILSHHEIEKDKVFLYIDAFGGIGLDAIAFSKNYKKVFGNTNYHMIVFEINPHTYYQALSQNLKNEKQCNLFFKSCLTYNPPPGHVHNIKNNSLLYYDPPWGPKYNKHSIFDIHSHYLEKTNLSLYEVLNMLVDIWAPLWIVVKLPGLSCKPEIEGYEMYFSIFSYNKKLVFYLYRCVRCVKTK